MQKEKVALDYVLKKKYEENSTQNSAVIPKNIYYIVNQTNETQEGQNYEVEILNKVNDLSALIDQTTNQILLKQQNEVLELLKQITQSLKSQGPIQVSLGDKDIQKLTAAVTVIRKQNSDETKKYMQSYIDQINQYNVYIDELMQNFMKNINASLGDLIGKIQVSVNNVVKQQKSQIDQEIQKIINRLKALSTSFDETLQQLI